MSIKAGDTVKHLPSGEEWTVAAVEGKYLSPSGWPESLAQLSDCELLESCSEHESMDMIRTWAEDEKDSP